MCTADWISYMSQMCLMTVRPSEDIEGCLKCLDVIVRYAYIPKEALSVYVYILCIVVNMEIHAAETWRITKNLMGTHLGHSALYTMCQIIQAGFIFWPTQTQHNAFRRSIDGKLTDFANDANFCVFGF